MNLILLGAPGAGKGTQAVKISEKYQIPAIATGDILRAERKAGTELGNAAQAYIEAGQLVPDSVVIGIIKKYMVENNCENGFILDGFPRSIPQAEALETMGIHLDAVLSIEVPDQKIIERMSGRRVCSCGSSYTSHSRRMPVILMPPSQTVSEIFSHKPHTEVFFPLHHHTKFPVRTESLLRCLAKPVLRTSPSSRPGMCSSVQIPCSKLPSFHNRFCIFSSL